MDKKYWKLLINVTDFLEWLEDDDACEKKDKLPTWAKHHIKEKLKQLNFAFDMEDGIK
jgi:hypothetical protein